MLHEFFDLSHDDLVRGHAFFFDAFDLDTRKREQVRELCRGVSAKVDVRAKPG